MRRYVKFGRMLSRNFGFAELGTVFLLVVSGITEMIGVKESTSSR